MVEISCFSDEWRGSATFNAMIPYEVNYKGLVNIKAKRIQNIIRCSQLYQDTIQKKLQPQLDRNSDIVLQAHKVCIEKYLHPKEVQKAVKRHTGDTDVSIPAPKRAKWSEVPRFNFQQHCI